MTISFGGKNISLSKTSKYQVSSQGSVIHIVATVETVNTDNTAVLRLGTSCVLINVERMSPDVIGRYVLVQSRMSSLHPTHI